MAPSSKKRQSEGDKGQRSISSFFAAKQPSHAASAGQPGPDQPRPKRQRTSDGDQPHVTQQRNQAPPVQAAPKVAPISGTADVTPSEKRASEAEHQQEPDPAGIPARQSARHQRFQNKLVIGRGNSKRDAAAPADAGAAKPKYTPLELQIVALRRKHPNVLLIVEVGYKFRFFGEDAEIAARECNIFAYPDHNFLTASVPVPRLHVYVRRLVEAGYKVGVVRQIETAAIKKTSENRNAPFTRELTAVYTRATLEAGDKQDVGEGTMAGRADACWSSQALSHYLISCIEQPLGSKAASVPQEAADGVGPKVDVEIGLVAVETSTGDVLWSQFRDGMLRGEFESRIMFVAPSELLIAQPVSSASQKLLGSYAQQSRGLKAETVQRDKYDKAAALQVVQDFYAGATEEAGALSAVEQLPPLVLQALAHALDYLQPLKMEGVLRMGATFRPFNEAHEMSLSPNALRQLEVLRNSEDGSERGSLLWLLDHTLTAFGGRMLRSWVAHPLRSVKKIEERLDAVEELLNVAGAMDEDGPASPLAALPRLLAKLPDLERGITRILHRTANPAEFVTVVTSLSRIATQLGLQVSDSAASAKVAASGIASALLQRLLQAAASPQVAAASLEMLQVIDDSAAQLNDKIGLFASPEKFQDVFRCKEDVASAETALQDILKDLRRQLQLPSLDYKTVQNQGEYLIEVPTERTDVPKGWEKVCSTKKFNRFHPPQVKEALQVLEVAKEHLTAAADTAWLAFLAEFAQHYIPFRAAVQALGALDALQSLAVVANNTGYVRPRFISEESAPCLHITGGRHPVLDAMMEGAVVPNDVEMSHDGPRAVIITGPNMGGKSCYLRMVALIAIMAQVGCLVPAQSATLHVLDAVFTRMGASDNLAMGRSTFLEELTETSLILQQASPRSLVIVDELGRGTSTHDGLAIAVATLSYLIQHNACLTLFVTHFPEVPLSLQAALCPALLSACRPLHCLSDFKVAALQELCPGQVVTRRMSYMQQGSQPAGAAEAQQPAGQPPALELSAGAVSFSGSNERLPSQDTATSAADLAIPRITFLYKLIPGLADRSFGLNVARLALLPESVVQNAARKAAEMQLDTSAKSRSQVSTGAGVSASPLSLNGRLSTATALNKLLQSLPTAELAQVQKLQDAIQKFLQEQML